MDEFKSYCLANNVHLTEMQSRIAEAMLASDEIRKFLFLGYGAGKSFLFELLEDFADCKSNRV